jgi:hypothetical protein
MEEVHITEGLTKFQDSEAMQKNEILFQLKDIQEGNDKIPKNAQLQLSMSSEQDSPDIDRRQLAIGMLEEGNISSSLGEASRKESLLRPSLPSINEIYVSPMESNIEIPPSPSKPNERDSLLKVVSPSATGSRSITECRSLESEASASDDASVISGPPFSSLSNLATDPGPNLQNHSRLTKSSLSLAGLSRWDTGETEIIVVSSAKKKSDKLSSQSNIRSFTARISPLVERNRLNEIIENVGKHHRKSDPEHSAAVRAALVAMLKEEARATDNDAPQLEKPKVLTSPGEVSNSMTILQENNSNENKHSDRILMHGLSQPLTTATMQPEIMKSKFEDQSIRRRSKSQERTSLVYRFTIPSKGPSSIPSFDVPGGIKKFEKNISEETFQSSCNSSKSSVEFFNASDRRGSNTSAFKVAERIVAPVADLPPSHLELPAPRVPSSERPVNSAVTIQDRPSTKCLGVDDIQKSIDLLLAEDEPKSSAYSVQRFELPPGASVSRASSIRSSPGSNTNTPHESLLNAHQSGASSTLRAESGHSHGSILGRIFHHEHGSPSSTQSSSPKRSHNSLNRKSGSFMERFDRLVHPEHFQGSSAEGTPSNVAEGAPEHRHLSEQDASSGSGGLGTESPKVSSPRLPFLSRKRSSSAATKKLEQRLHRSNSESSLHEKYGFTKEFLGKGANATVRLAHKKIEHDHHHHHHHHHHHTTPQHPNNVHQPSGLHQHQEVHGSIQAINQERSNTPTSITQEFHQGQIPGSSTLPRDGNREGSQSHHQIAPDGESPRSSSQHQGQSSGYNSANQITRSGSISTGASESQDFVPERLFAIKKFRKKRKEETEREYVKKLSSEFCVSSSLHHPHVIETVDLIQDEDSNWCQVMEFMAGGDLFSRIASGPSMSDGEINCIFGQLVSGVAYLHSIGVAHRDLKPEVREN